MTAAGIIRTVDGDLEAGTAGATLLHDHVISSVTCYWEPGIAPEIAGVSLGLDTLSKVRQHPFAVRSNLVLDDIDVAVAELRLFAAAGGGLLVDATSNGLGRDPRAIAIVAARSGVPLVLGCGYYIGSTHPSGFGSRREADLAEEMAREVLVGIGGTSMRAGVIGEIGVGSFPMHPLERRVLRAAAFAQRETGAGIIVHAAPGDRSAFEIAQTLARAGARMDKVLVSHLDERFRSSRALFRRFARYGTLFGLDTFGREIYWAGRQRQHPSDEERIRIIVQLVESGLGDRIVLDQDICLRHELTTYGGHGYGHVLENIVPRLRASGVPDSELNRMLVTTPQAFLALPASVPAMGLDRS